MRSSLTHLRITDARNVKEKKKKTHSVWGPECRETVAAHPERLVVWQLRGSRMTQNPSHPPPPTHHTSANKHHTHAHTSHTHTRQNKQSLNTKYRKTYLKLCSVEFSLSTNATKYELWRRNFKYYCHVWGH